MNSEIKNLSPNTIKLFVRENGIEKQVDIPSGGTKIVDDYETRMIKIYKRKELISMRPAQLKKEVVDVVDENKTMTMTNIDPNSDEVMDNFHTTKDHEVVLADDKGDIKFFQENLMKNLRIPEDSTSFDIIEDEVNQYVEGGYVKGVWTDEDITYLKRNYPTKGRTYCSIHLNRNESSVQKKINSLGLKKRKKRKKKK